MQTVMLQFRHKGQPPSLEDARRLFGLKPGEIDTAFGVIAVDPREGIYTVLVAETASERVRAVFASRPPDPVEGVFANTRIEPFGPPGGDVSE